MPLFVLVRNVHVWSYISPLQSNEDVRTPLPQTTYLHQYYPQFLLFTLLMWFSVSTFPSPFFIALFLCPLLFQWS